MRFRLFIRIVIGICIVLLCAGFGIYSYMHMNAAERHKDFNLYALVPQDAVAVLETNRMDDLVKDINNLACSQEGRFLYVSELFVYLKEYLHLLMDDTPHGLSKQMNKMLISFHEPDYPMNQVLYCSLGAGDAELVEYFMQKYCKGAFQSKNFTYKGETIRIYALANGRFLATYFTKDFLVVSFQKRLVEQVIDAYKGKQSVLHLDSFQMTDLNKSANVAATVYVRMRSVDMGSKADTLRSEVCIGDWAEFGITLNEEIIYCSGISHDADTIPTFMNALKRQQPISRFVGEQLPVTTFFYDVRAMSDRRSMFDFMSTQVYSGVNANVNKEQEKKWLNFIDTYIGSPTISCLFQGVARRHSKAPCAVLRVPLNNMERAQKDFQDLVEPLQDTKQTIGQQYGQRYVQYTLLLNSFLAQLTGITSADRIYACLYQDALLLSPDEESLPAYIKSVSDGDVLAGTPAYEDGIGSLSSTYAYMMMFDMESVLHQPSAYVRLVPNFFIKHAKFFRHFYLSIQFTYREGVMYPNIVLFYKH